MTELEVNKIIHEARGFEIDYKQFPHVFITSIPEGASYTTNWIDYGQALEWAIKQEWWIFFQGEGRKWRHLVSQGFLNPLIGSTILAEFIMAHPEYFKKEE